MPRANRSGGKQVEACTRCTSTRPFRWFRPAKVIVWVDVIFRRRRTVRAFPILACDRQGQVMLTAPATGSKQRLPQAGMGLVFGCEFSLRSPMG